MKVGLGDMTQPFHYGSHYSSPGFVLHYLVRLQPFSALHVTLQVRHTRAVSCSACRPACAT